MLRIHPLLILLALILGPALVGQSESKLVTEFRKAVASDPRRPTALADRIGGLQHLSGLDSKAVAEALADAHNSVEMEIAALEQTRLAGLGEKRELLKGQEGAASRSMPKAALERFKALSAELDQLRGTIDGLRDLQHAVRQRLLELRAIGAREYLLDKVIGDRRQSLALKLAAAQVVGHGGAAAVEDIVRGLRRAKQVPEKVALIDALSALGPEQADGDNAATALLDLLDSDEEAVRERAALALASWRWPPAIAPLIDLLEREQGLVRTRIVGALEVLTRQQHGESVGAWRAWYEAEGSGLTAADLGGGRPGDAEAFDRGNYYFGLPQDGKGILYILDASGSMKHPIRLETGGAGTQAGGGEVAETTRLEACKKELIRALGTLTPDKKFNVIWYNDLPYMWNEAMQPVNATAVAAAQDWVRALSHASTTNIHDALQMGFSLVGRGVHDKYYGVELDQIFLLTDGSPTKVDGSADSTDKILQAVRDWNPLQRITIHTIGIGGDLNAPFLEQLARENGGEFKRY